MNSNATKTLAIAVLTVISFTLNGCGNGDTQGILGGILSGISAIGQRGTLGGNFPGAPTTGIGNTALTPNLGTLTGGLGGNGTPPPRLTGPQAPVSFGNDVNKILAQYNAQITGPSITPDRVQRVLTALQLYKGRNHQITINIAADDSKLPTSAMWSTDGYSANVDFWQPELQHTINHEIAHDMTLLAMANEGRQLQNDIAARSNDSGTWPSSYSQTNEDEAAAEIVSFLAAIYSGVPIDERPYNSFNPAEVIRKGCQAFYSDKVLAAVR